MSIEIHDMAAEVIRDCGRYIQELARAHGEFSPRCAPAAVSWARAIGEALDLCRGGGTLSRDGERSLYGVTAYKMHFGVIYRPDARFRDVMTGPDRALMCLGHGEPATDRDSKECAQALDTEDATLCYVVDAPIPGEWSIHS